MAELLHDRVEWDLQDGVARVTLANPDGGNALDMATSLGIHEAARRVDAGARSGDVRVAVLAARGKTFCVGGDLREFAGAEDRGKQVSSTADELHAAILLLTDAPAPVVSVVHGTVAGGGIGIALSADVVLIAEQAKMRLAYTAAGLSPDCGSTWMLSRRLGPARALDLALTNRLLTGAEAASWGLASRAVPADDLGATTEELVAALRSGPREAYAETKRLMAAGPRRDLATSMNDESATIGRLIVGADGIEGIDSFLAKRTPIFD